MRAACPLRESPTSCPESRSQNRRDSCSATASIWLPCWVVNRALHVSAQSCPGQAFNAPTHWPVSGSQIWRTSS